MASIIPLAFAGALYPTLLAGVIVLLARDKPAGMLAAFLAGGMLISIASGLIIVFALGGAVSTKNQRSASPTIDLIAGILSIALAAVLWRRAAAPGDGAEKSTKKKKKDGPSRTQRMLGEGSAWAAFGAGLILNIPGIWYLEALKDISKANAGTAATVAAILAFVLVMFVLAEIPLIGYVVAPDGTRLVVTRSQAWFSAHAMAIAMWAAALIGIYLTIKGIAGIA